MAVKKTLKMVFGTAVEGDNVVVNVDKPKDTLTLAEATAAAPEIQKIFESTKGNPATSFSGATIITTEETVLA